MSVGVTTDQKETNNQINLLIKFHSIIIDVFVLEFPVLAVI